MVSAALQAGTKEVGSQLCAQTALTRENFGYAMNRKLGGPRGRSGRVGKISPLSRLDPRVQQFVAGDRTDYAVPAALYSSTGLQTQAKADSYKKILDPALR
jgi:hypothetical protein